MEVNNNNNSYAGDISFGGEKVKISELKKIFEGHKPIVQSKIQGTPKVFTLAKPDSHAPMPTHYQNFIPTPTKKEIEELKKREEQNVKEREMRQKKIEEELKIENEKKIALEKLNDTRDQIGTDLKQNALIVKLDGNGRPSIESAGGANDENRDYRGVLDKFDQNFLTQFQIEVKEFAAAKKLNDTKAQIINQLEENSLIIKKGYNGNLFIDRSRNPGETNKAANQRLLEDLDQKFLNEFQSTVNREVETNAKEIEKERTILTSTRLRLGNTLKNGSLLIAKGEGDKISADPVGKLTKEMIEFNEVMLNKFDQEFLNRFEKHVLAKIKEQADAEEAYQNSLRGKFASFISSGISFTMNLSNGCGSKRNEESEQ